MLPMRHEFKSPLDVCSFSHGAGKLVCFLLRQTNPVEDDEVSLCCKVASYCIEQVYVNSGNDSGEGMFVLHLDPCSVVFDFQLKCKDGVLEGQVIEIECKDTSGFRSGSQLQRMRSQNGLSSEQPYCFRVNLGSLSKGRLEVQLEFVTRLVLDSNNDLVVRIPRHIIQCVQQSAKGTNHTELGARTRIPGKSEKATINIVLMGRQIRAVSCGSDGIMKCKTSISQKGANIAIQVDQVKRLQQDVVVGVEMVQPVPMVHVSCEKNEDCLAVMISIIPLMSHSISSAEYILMIDRTKALTPAQISCEKRAARAFLKLVPPESYINIIALGSEMQVFLRYPQQSTESLIMEAMEFLNLLTIDKHGGADVLGALKYLRDGSSGNDNQKVLFMTGGKISNSSQILDFLKEHQSEMRFFVLGVSVQDKGAQIMIKSIARAGCGTCEFVSTTSPDEVDQAVAKQFDAASTQGMHEIALQWNYTKHGAETGDKNPLQFLSKPLTRGLQKLPLMHMPPITEKTPNSQSESDTDSDFLNLWGEGSVTSPFKIPPVFSGESLLIFTMFKAGHVLPKSLSLVANCPTKQTWTIPLNPDEFLKGEAIHTMAARALVEDLDGGTSLLHELKADQQTIEVEMIDTSCRYMIPSSKTVFVCAKTMYREDGQLEAGSVVIPPPPVKITNSGGLNDRESIQNLDDVWRRGRKSIAKSFRVASINLRFAMAFSKFKSTPSEEIIKGTRSKLTRLKSSRSKRLLSSNRGPSSGLLAENMPRSKKQGIGSKVRFFNGRKSTTPIVNPKLYIKGLLKMQTSNGSFMPFESVANYLNFSFNSFRSILKEVMSEYHRPDDGAHPQMGISLWKEIWGSCVVMGFLHRKLLEHKNIWEDAIEKTDNWLKTALEANNLSADDIKAAAQEYVAENSDLVDA